MKASIITMTTTYNYGATLQAYALQEFIKKLGYECDVIDHMSSAQIHRKIKLTDFSKINLIKIPYKWELEKGYRSFEDFYEKHMQMGRRYETVEELKANPPDSDVFISGSDQVWNYKDPKLNRFLLDFVPDDKIKISYAASLGNSELPEEMHDTYREALKRFDSISVREQEGYQLIQPLTDRKVSINCDPAFLLDADEWRALEKPVSGIKKGEYILCYLLYTPPWINEWLKELKAKTNKKIVIVGLNGYRRIFCDKYVRCAGPGEFMYLVDNASMVVSSSFHGNVFSVLFGKDFVSLPDPKRPDRIYNLLRNYGLEDHIILDNTYEFNHKMQNYHKIDSIIKKEQEKSKKYLNDVFYGAKGE